MAASMLALTLSPIASVQQALAQQASQRSLHSRSSDALWLRSQASESSTRSAPAIERVVTAARPGRIQQSSFALGSISTESPSSVPPETLPAGKVDEIGSWERSEFVGAEGCDSCDGLTDCHPPGFLLDWSRCDLFAGVAGFSSAGNFLTSGTGAAGKLGGAFGFQGGLNFGSQAPGLLGGQVGTQLGLRAITAQLEGTSAGEDSRNQLFVTAGLFRRVDYGLQGGAVVDYLHDNGLATVDLLQLRGELSFLMSPCHEAGFRFTSSLKTAETSTHIAGLVGDTAVRMAALDTYRFFYRYRFGPEAAGLAEIHGGFSEDRDGLVGLSLATPLQGNLGLTSTMTYLVPHSGTQPTYTNEAWNLGVGLVWTPGRAFGAARDYYRPLMDVADNGILIGRMLR